ncbi:transglycosylase SLT domain-containing protein [Nioella nitratireducens]|uniref:transglycosylase SLT domain-containing protein n=1 Tax=Nioella nitratireducens TaxID=1287720 RepID=UPI0008FD3C96
MRVSAFLIGLVALPVLSACAAMRPEPEVVLTTRWDHRPEAEMWTRASMDMLESDAAVLTQVVPQDAEYWCPGYSEADEAQRAAFWVGFMSALARYESTWNPQAVGGGGRWYGLLQIAPATARYRGCEAGSGAALTDGAANLRCALRIMAVTVPRDGVVSQGTRGVAADWGPMRNPEMTAEMRDWLHRQSYCQG